MPRYDYTCENSACGYRAELLLPAKSSTRARTCPKCKARRFARDFLANARAAVVGDAIIRFSNRFPYISKSLPFGGNLAGTGRHVGALRQIEVQDARHEDRLRAVHGYGGENRIDPAGARAV